MLGAKKTLNEITLHRPYTSHSSLLTDVLGWILEDDCFNGQFGWKANIRTTTSQIGGKTPGDGLKAAYRVHLADAGRLITADLPCGDGSGLIERH